MSPTCAAPSRGGGQSATACGQFAVQRLAKEERGTVVDRTELEGLFDYTDSTASPKPPLRIAIQEQLGLKLDSVEGSVPIPVIDEAEKPVPD